jgi:hypothetical protein
MNNEIDFYFLIKNSCVCCYRDNYKIEVDKEIENKTNEFEIRKYKPDENFKIIIQTYNSNVIELEVNSEMTVEELKNKIENLLKIRKNYQELLYLVYKLKDDKRTLKEYYIRPNGIVFLRGHYFPLIFSYFYNKSLKYILGINIAEQISQIKKDIIFRLKLDYNNFILMSNGKELEDSKYLIEYNIQKLQVIYIK